MGRKEGQRTKGNTKVRFSFVLKSLHSFKDQFFQPSSSARSAELLSSTSLKSSTILTSTPNVDISSTIFGLTPLTAEEEKEIPDELKMALKKLSKKDSTTKLKVINSLISFVPLGILFSFLAHFFLCHYQTDTIVN